MMFQYIKKRFSFLKINFLESEFDGGGNDEEPDRNKLSSEEIQQAKKAVHYLLDSGESFTCKKFQKGGEFYYIRRRVMNILGFRFGESIYPETIEYNYEKLGLKNYWFLNMIFSYPFQDIIPVKDVKSALRIGSQKQSEAEDILIQRLKGLNLKTRIHYLQQNPDEISSRILSSCYPDIDTLILQDGKLDGELIIFLKQMIEIISTQLEGTAFLNYLAGVENRFSEFERVMNQISILRLKYKKN